MNKDLSENVPQCCSKDCIPACDYCVHYDRDQFYCEYKDELLDPFNCCSQFECRNCNNK